MCSRYFLRQALEALVLVTVASSIRVPADTDHDPVCVAEQPAQVQEPRQQSLLQVHSHKTSGWLLDDPDVWHPFGRNISQAAANVSEPLRNTHTSDGGGQLPYFTGASKYTGELHRATSSTPIIRVNLTAEKYIDDMTVLLGDADKIVRASVAGLFRATRTSKNVDILYVFLWIFAPILMVACAMVAYMCDGTVYTLGRVLPLSTACSLCAAVGFGTESWGFPWTHFSPTMALITVVFVMDLGTLERFIIKITLRGLGTIAGGVLAILAAETTNIFDQNVTMQASWCFTILAIDMVLAKKFNYMAYTFTMTSVTFTLVFFGYIHRGWEALFERLFSVLIGELLAIACTMFFFTTCMDRTQARSAVSIIEKAEQIFDRALVALDFAFIRSAILSSKPDEELKGLAEKYKFREEVCTWFRLEEDPEKKELEDLARSLSFHDLPMDVTVSVLQAECRQCWKDMKFVRAIFPCSCFGRQIFGRIPNFVSLPERAHPVFLQASALAHSGPIEDYMWHQERDRLNHVRVAVQGLHAHFAILFQHKIASLKQKQRDELETTTKEEVLHAFRGLVRCLQDAQTEICAIWTPGTSCSSTTHGPCEKFEGFCQGVNLIVMDFGLLSLCCIKLLTMDYTVSDEIDDICQTLANIAGVNAEDIDEQMEAPLDIESSTIVANWRRRAASAAAKGIGGLQSRVSPFFDGSLLPGHRSPTDSVSASIPEEYAVDTSVSPRAQALIDV